MVKPSAKMSIKLSSADFITLTRFPLAILFFIFIQDKWTAFALFLLIGLSDLLDGYVARKTNKVTKYGGALDPLADKFFLVGAFIAYLIIGKLYWWEFLLLIVRDIYSVSEMIYIAVTKDTKKHKASIFGKLTTFLQNAVIVIIIFEIGVLLLPLIIATFISSIITIYNYATNRWDVNKK